MKAASGLVVFFVAACATLIARRQTPPGDVDLIIDCRLPPQLIFSVGGPTVLPLQAVRTTAEVCVRQGGRYTKDDVRCDIELWKQHVRGHPDDVTARHNIGALYQELPDLPQDATAAEWYESAAPSYRPAAAVLARMYEEGIGVDRDWAKSLRWSQVAGAIDDPRVKLRQARIVIEKLEHSTESTFIGPAVALHLVGFRRADLEPTPSWPSARLQLAAAFSASEQLQAVQDMLPGLEAAAEDAERHPGAVRQHPVPPQRKAYALLIGNQAYKSWPPISTAIADARDVAAVLTARYGFSRVETIPDGTKTRIADAFQRLRAEVAADVRAGVHVSFVLYYAGHWAPPPKNSPSAYWIPTDAAAQDEDQWISEVQIARQIDAMAANQVLVIADVPFQYTLPGRGLVPEEQYVDVNHPRKVLAWKPAGLPSVATEGRTHSPFAAVLLRVLSNGRTGMTGEQIFSDMRGGLSASLASHLAYLTIGSDARSDAGDFVFLEPTVHVAASDHAPTSSDVD